MGAWDGLNRRKFPRVKYPCLLVIRNKHEESDILLTHTENIGVGGVCIVLKKSVPMFCPVELELDLLDLGSHVKCTGKVVWNVQRKMEAKEKPLHYDIGVEFDALNDKDTERLDVIVKRLVKSNRDVPYR